MGTTSTIPNQITGKMLVLHLLVLISIDFLFFSNFLFGPASCCFLPGLNKKYPSLLGYGSNLRYNTTLFTANRCCSLEYGLIDMGD